MHRLHNPGEETLELIEVQVGDYLGEDDIVRFEDTYGRAVEPADADAFQGATDGLRAGPSNQRRTVERNEQGGMDE